MMSFVETENGRRVLRNPRGVACVEVESLRGRRGPVRVGVAALRLRSRVRSVTCAVETAGLADRERYPGAPQSLTRSHAPHPALHTVDCVNLCRVRSNDARLSPLASR
jgi:hypothetical protein